MVYFFERYFSNYVFFLFAAPVTNAAPRIIQPPELNVNIIAGETLTLECVVEGSPVPVVTWNKYGGILPDRATQVLGKYPDYVEAFKGDIIHCQRTLHMRLFKTSMLQ